MKKKSFLFFFLLSIVTLTMNCTDTDVEPPVTGLNDLVNISYQPVPYQTTPNRFNANQPYPYPVDLDSSYFPKMVIPADNPLTVEGVELGRRLFYDPILSSDSTMSCSSCHLPSGSFTDNKAQSKGVTGAIGQRSSMSLLNVGYYTNGLFWDGRVKTLEQQALLPVEDGIELHENWGNVEAKLRRNKDYPTRFRQSFGISSKTEITKTLAVKALAQFERTLVSSGRSRYDQMRKGLIFPTDDEAIGYTLYFNSDTNLPDAQCGHCHQAPLLAPNSSTVSLQFMNNGLDEVKDSLLTGFKDLGLGGVSKIFKQNGQFRAPTLRNIALTAPYMHDGRFQTMEEVIDHYFSGGKFAPNKNPLVTPFPIKDPVKVAEYKKQLLAFLNTMTDTEFATNKNFQNPFK
jgi:cytochrome c peroxidase